MNYYSIPEMASMLDVCRETIKKYIKRNHCFGKPGKDITGNTITFYSDDEYELIQKSIEETRGIDPDLLNVMQVAKMAGITRSYAHLVAIKYNIPKISKPTSTGRKLFFTKANAEKIVDIVQLNKDKRYKAAKKTPEKITQFITQEKAEDHPLVKDQRFLNMNFWPDVTPVCFEDLDKETN